MNNDEKPIDVFSLFGGAVKPQQEKEIPVEPKTNEDEIREWLSVDNDFLFEPL